MYTVQNGVKKRKKKCYGEGVLTGHLTRNLRPEQIVQAERTSRSARL